MQPQRETLTDSLANIIQILQLGYRSGTLTVDRSAGHIIEEGYMVFVNGRVIEAQTRQYSGQAAFDYLQTWGRCRFSFTNANDTTTASPSGSHSSPPISAPPPPRSPSPTDISKRGVHSPFPRLSPSGVAAVSSPDAAHLDRIHRRLLLLVNGQRDLTVLARLMARSPEEVQVLLDDLEHADLIHQ